jgi:protein ImuA
MPQDPQILRRLRQQIGPNARSGAEAPRVALGLPALDAALGGGVERAALHEVYSAAVADASAALAFALGVALRIAGARPVVWAREEFVDVETGGLHPPGLADFGFTPDRAVLVRTKDAAGALRAAESAARCPGLGAVMLEVWGEPRQLDLTASRRLALVAGESGAPLLMLRHAARPCPSAAMTRWRVRAAPSTPLEANAPGGTAFMARLLRRRGGLDEGEWELEWSHERQRFESRNRRPDDAIGAPLSRFVAPLPADRPAAAGGARRAG